MTTVIGEAASDQLEIRNMPQVSQGTLPPDIDFLANRVEGITSELLEWWFSVEDAREVFVDMENMEHILEAFTKLRVGCIFKMVGFPVGVRGRVEAQYKINQLFPERNEIIASNIMASHNKKTFHIGDNLKILHEDMPRMSARID